MWDYIETNGTLEAKLSVTIGSFREPGWTNRRQKKSDLVWPLKGPLVHMWERSHKCVWWARNQWGLKGSYVSESWTCIWVYEERRQQKKARKGRKVLRVDRCLKRAGWSSDRGSMNWLIWPSGEPWDEGFLQSFREQVRDFCDLRQKLTVLFILFRWSSISVTSLMKWSI
jgi:hypothetical protein